MLTPKKAAVLSALVVAAIAADPAAAAGRPKVDVNGFGTATTIDAGSVAITGTATGEPFDGVFTAALAAIDGSLPDPGSCKPATATLRVDGNRQRFVQFEATGDVCGQWLQPPTSVVTHVFTGRYEATAPSKPRLVATDGFFEVRLAADGRASVFAIDT